MGLTEVSEGASYGNRAWFVDGKHFVWERPFSKADIERFGDQPGPDGLILAARVDDLAHAVVDAWLACAPSALADEWVRQHGPSN